MDSLSFPAKSLQNRDLKDTKNIVGKNRPHSPTHLSFHFLSGGQGSSITLGRLATIGARETRSSSGLKHVVKFPSDVTGDGSQLL
ncbi:hypothetical protein CEXT_341401 [Caerostris extrusa]|uniref:Uncharacterized protein n=1 Tax=Caerostris extrusa TaxID=172846 RepID=A0AAV4NEM5_CAEEX|nr:hypothetical protein CEXT_341401 [Caerostris extrusa]